MARGYPGAFGRKINAPYVWLPLCAFFLLGLLDWRRPAGSRTSTCSSCLGFGRLALLLQPAANIGVSVPLVYPVLLYLLGADALDRLPGPRGRAFGPSLPTAWLAIARDLPARRSGSPSTSRTRT